ncbi:MAG: hypothetical protein RLP09_17265 [Sandaracinaceae bacterium]
MEVIRLHFSCAIPVGHRVRIRWYLTPRGGAGPMLRRPKQPVIEDLDTEILHAPGWALHAMGDDGVRELSQLLEEPPDTLRLERTLLGRVIACTVVSMPANGAFPLQTRLVIEPEPESSPYR